MTFIELPLKVQEDCLELSNRIAKWKENSLDLIKIVKNTGIYFELKAINGDYYFIISDPIHDRPAGNKTTFSVTYLPHFDTTYEARINRGGVELIEISFNSWINKIKRLNEARLRYEQLQKSFSDEENYIPFEEILDDEATLRPDQQKEVERALIHLQISLEENKEKYDLRKILETVIVLRQNLPTLPERVIKQIGQSIFKQINELGAEAMRDIVKDVLKDFFKYLFFDNALKPLLKHLHLLPH